MTDLYMPVMDGFALVEKIRQDEALREHPRRRHLRRRQEAQERALERAWTSTCASR